MAISSSTFSNAGGAVNDLFNAYGQFESGKLKGQALRLKSQGDLAEAGQYDLAAGLAEQNKQYTISSTAIQQAQQERESTMQIGGQQASIAGAGFANSGSALDILADSARQGALAQAVLGQQGHITEAGYEEQAQSYNLMASTARYAAAQEAEMANQTENASNIAAIGDVVGSLFKGGAAIMSLL